MRHLWLILAFIIAIWAGRNLLTQQHFYTHDDMQVFRVGEYASCLSEIEFPCRWAKDLGKGYGYPLFNYYPPMIYLVPAIFHLAGLPIILSLNLFAFGSFLLAAVGMYLLARMLTGSNASAFLASTLYTLYPFHAINTFIRGVYGENLAWALIPLLLYWLLRSIQRKSLSLFFILGLSAVYLTHVLSSLVVTSLIILFTIAWSLGSWKKLFQNLIRTVAMTFLSLLSASFFILPMALEKDLVQADTLTQGYYTYTNHYVSLNQLLLEYKWNYGPSLWGEAKDEMPYMVGHIHSLLLLILGLIFAFKILVTKKLTLAKDANIFIAIFTFAIFLLLSHYKSDPLWQMIPYLSYFQFPWRFVAWAGLGLALAVSLLFVKTIPGKLQPLLAVIIAISLLIYTQPFFTPRAFDTYTDHDYLVGKERAEQQVKSLYDYLPLEVKQVPEPYGEHNPESIRTSHSYRQDFNLSEATSVEFPIFAFPGWQATIDDVPQAWSASDPHGLITLELPQGESTVTLELKDTPARFWGNTLSLFSLALLLLLLKLRQIKVE